MLRVGIVEYLNSLPLYYRLIDQEFSLPYQFVKAIPTILNQKIDQGELDVSLVSAFEYATHFEKYFVFPSMSISADGAVHSVFLFTHQPLSELQGTIQLPHSSATSIHLLQCLLQDHLVSFQYPEVDRSQEYSGELMIGDAAIQLFLAKKYRYAYDLSALWKEKYQLPFVFAFWVIRKDRYAEKQTVIHQLFHDLRACLQEAPQRLPEIAQNHYHNVFPDADACVEYLQNLIYEFTDDFQEGFLEFQRQCVHLGFLREVAPLEFLAI